MGYINTEVKRHAVCVPYPAQGHINPMLKVAKLLHHNGFFITFVHTEHNHRRLLRSRGPSLLDGLPDFRFVTIPDGLPFTDPEFTQDIPSLCVSVTKNFLAPFRELLVGLNSGGESPPVSCIVSDGVMSFTLDAAEEFRLPEVIFWTTSAVGFLSYLHYKDLLERGVFPLKEESCLVEENLDIPVHGIPGLNDIRLRNFPSFIRSTDPNDIMFNFLHREAQRVRRASAVILNTFDELEGTVLSALKQIIPKLYTVGPLSLLCNRLENPRVMSMASNLWKEDESCMKWLDTKEPGTVVYVNFGSITVVTVKQLEEFAWGLANTNHPFLWVVRPDLVKGEAAIVPEEFVSATADRSLMVEWVPQEDVLKHPAVGGFLTHSGWNSTIESITFGVPVLCWPFFAEQQTNCWHSRTEWGIGMEIDNNVKRGEVEGLVRELIDGEKGKEMGRRAGELMVAAIEATKRGGSSYTNFNKFLKEELSTV